MARSYILWIILGVLLLGAGIFTVNKVSNSTAVADSTISYSEEIALGNQMYEQEIATGELGRIVQDSLVNADLNNILHLLTSQITDPHYNYTVQVIDSSEVNAFSTLGGHLFFYSGIFNQLDNPEECLAVMAHEIGHNENRHQVKRYLESYGLSALISLEPSVINQIIGGLSALSYSRNQEDEADHFAYQLMEKVGVHPKYFAYVMENFEKMAPNQEPPEILSDHPDTKRREQEALNYSVPAGFVEKPINIDWKAFKEHLSKRQQASGGVTAR